MSGSIIYLVVLYILDQLFKRRIGIFENKNISISPG